MEILDLPEKLKKEKDLTDSEFKYILENNDLDSRIRTLAVEEREKIYGKDVYVRGLIEFTNYCKNDCYYCGIRRSNLKAHRYRLTRGEILACCDEGYKLGYRTFVLQGGEDLSYSDDDICGIVSSIKESHPDCAVTLSIGEKSRETYLKYYSAGTDRYLLRHETADNEHYSKLHPANMSPDNRKRCLYDLKEIGFQVGAGFMVGSPYQTTENIISDLRFLKELSPDMIGIGPYLTHDETPFAGFKNGSYQLTIKLLSILRLMFPYVLLPATTALGTINVRGREEGILAGANVLMPNLSPVSVRKYYELYENKICTGDESAQCRNCLEKRVESIGYRIITDIGNVKR